MTTANSRAWMRLSPADKHVQLKSAEGIITAEVVDVSFGGVAITLDRPPQLAEGDPVDVNWRGTWMRGRVRNLAEQGTGVRLGIEWTTSKAAAQ
jgi:hypothetical protein